MQAVSVDVAPKLSSVAEGPMRDGTVGMWRFLVRGLSIELGPEAFGFEVSHVVPSGPVVQLCRQSLVTLDMSPFPLDR